MPLYEYQCDSCGHQFERIRKFSDPPLTECPACGGSVRKLVSSPAFQFKGSGFYITDYARKDSGSDKDSGGGTEAAGKGSGAAKGDDKPAAASSTGETSSGSAGGATPAGDKPASPAKSDSKS